MGERGRKQIALDNINAVIVVCLSSLFLNYYSDIGIGQSQDDSIVGLRQTKHIPPALPVSGTLSSSNPDLLQSHHRILDFNTTPGEHQFSLSPVELFFIYITGSCICGSSIPEDPHRYGNCRYRGSTPHMPPHPSKQYLGFRP